MRAVEEALWAFGYRTAILSRSGQRRGPRADSLALDGDLAAFSPRTDRPNLIIEVGGPKKSVSLSLSEMTAQALPAGLLPIVVRQVASRPTRKWRWNVSSAVGFDSPEEFLSSMYLKVKLASECAEVVRNGKRLDTSDVASLVR